MSEANAILLDERLAPPSEAIPPPPTAISAGRFHNIVLDHPACEDPDCVLVTLENEEFPTRKDLLASTSQVFADMFDIASHTPPGTIPAKGDENTPLRIEVVETSHVLSLLLTAAHATLPILPARERRLFIVGTPDPDPKKAHIASEPPPEGLLPFEHVRELIRPIGQKYRLSPPVMKALRSQLTYHIPAYPLQVYAVASELAAGSLILPPSLLPPSVDPAGPASDASEKESHEESEFHPKIWSAVASDASQFLLTPTLTSRPLHIALQFPTAESYAALLYLQNHRIGAFKSILSEENKSIVFPFDYGICKDHWDVTRKLWERRKRILLDQLDAGTDVAEEMGKTCLPAVRSCETCHRGVNAAVEMLRVRVFDSLEPDEEHEHDATEVQADG
jgi:hypothetical protein